ncbi:MAG TPA: hypothetical protein VKE72_06985, partial [Methylocella sp.]|nr:hypothetical protein [Methylocella sp.]
WKRRISRRRHAIGRAEGLRITAVEREPGSWLDNSANTRTEGSVESVLETETGGGVEWPLGLRKRSRARSKPKIGLVVSSAEKQMQPVVGKGDHILRIDSLPRLREGEVSIIHRLFGISGKLSERTD